MNTLDRKYRDELTLALRLRDISGARVGEVLAEIEAHCAETGEDPATAFGPPREYAAKVAEQLDARTGKPSALQLVTGALACGTLVYVGITLLLDGLRAGGDVIPVTAADVVSAIVYLGLLSAAIVLGSWAATEVAKGRLYRVLAAVAFVGAVAGMFLSKALFDDETAIVELAPWTAVAVGGVALAGSLYLLRRAIRHGRVIDPRSARPH